MPISAEMKIFVAGLGNDKVWKKLPSDKEPNHTFISDLEEQIYDLVGTVQSDRSGGTTGHIGLIMSAAEFLLIPNTTPFIRSTHLGTVNYLLPTNCTTINQHTERRCEHKILLHVFEKEQMIETQIKKDLMSCFDKNVYIQLKYLRLGYTNVKVQRFIEYLYLEYGKKSEELKNKALDDLKAEADFTGQSIKPFRLRQKKLKLFLEDTEQKITEGTYIKKTLGVIERSNFINKSVLVWKARALNQRTISLFWPFFTAAHKKQRLKLLQGNTEQVISVMMEKKMTNIALQIGRLKRYTDQQQSAINNLIDKVQDDQSRGDRSVPGMIETTSTPSTADSSEISIGQALISLLKSRLDDAKRNQYAPNRQRRQPGPGRGVDQNGTTGRGGRLADCEFRPQKVLGNVNKEKDLRDTRTAKDDTRTEKKCKNKNYCHTHGHECVEGYDSAHCMWPEKRHKPCATVENLMEGCLLYKQVLHCP